MGSPPRAAISRRRCVVEPMQHGAGDTGCPVVLVRTALIGDVVTVPLPLPRVRPPAPAVRQGSAVARLRTVDREAAEDLFNACYPRLAGWVRRLVDDDDTAHEIASEAFTRLLSRWTSLDNPQSYLYMIATNLVLYHYAGLPVREVASLLGRPEGTVKADLHQARARLRAALGESHA